MRFLSDEQKFLSIAKVRKYDKERVFFEEKLRLLKMHLHQIGKAQSMPAVFLYFTATSG